jgi:RHS repeat-associated protein
MTITYPSSGNPGVSYVYGSANETGATNGYKANRLERRTDEAGQVDYTYDALGNVASETALLKNTITGGNYQSYTTQYRWDNFGRLIDVTIPGTGAPLNTPAETIRYGYDAGGAVTSAWGRAGTTDHAYVRHVGYNEFGERVRMTYGNQAFSTYGYASDTRRLNYADTTIQPAGQSARLAQQLTFTYDLVGNLKLRDQALPLETNATAVVPVGGISNLFYFYDPLNQLTSADFFYAPRESQNFFANVNISYDEIGNIKQKVASEGGSPEFTGPNNYKFNPSYAGTTFNSSPHAASSISEERLGTISTRTLAYDRNGNVTSLLYGTTGRRITWTDTDRIRSMCAGTATTCPNIAEALYDAEGTRTHNKVTVSGTTRETLYVNQFLTVRNGTLPTKHVYLGDDRVASKAERNGTTNSTYWYHSDHIQSTQYVTTTGQALVQHLEYLPAGEIWREESNLSQPEVAHATTFTGKELDASGYYYYGARYYDPQIQMFLSPDPMIGQYALGSRTGGLHQPRNLALYTYAWNNPLRFGDSTGAEVDWRFIFNELNQGMADYKNGRIPEVGQPRGVWYWVGNALAGTADYRAHHGVGMRGATPRALPGARVPKALASGSQVAKAGAPVAADAATRGVRNGHLAGGTHPVTGIPFDKNGFPDFSGVAKAEVKIVGTGNRAGDFRAANEAAGLSRTPEGHTWHHHQDGTTMQLVPRDIHSKTGHTGGFLPVGKVSK